MSRLISTNYKRDHAPVIGWVSKIINSDYLNTDNRLGCDLTVCYSIMIACSDCLARCKQNLIDTKDELVVFPSSALRLKSNTTITKYDVGYVNITKEELYNAEQAGSFQHDDNNVWYLYDVKLTKIARLTPEYLDYTGVSKLTNVPTLDEILAEFHQNNWPIDFASPEFDSYREYLDIIFHAYEVDNDPDIRGRTCSRATPCIASLGDSDNVC